ncbi:MAG: DUF4280 domain-containing protein [Polyangiaceae bacterium]
MGKRLVVDGATLKCNHGSATSKFALLPEVANAEENIVATIADVAPMVNLKPFGQCNSPSNPQVAAATAAALGVLTPMPCMPVPAGPWSPGSEVTTVSGKKALTDDSTCKCTWAGTIEVTDPATTVTTE